MLAKRKMQPVPSYVYTHPMVDVNSRESGTDLMHRLLDVEPIPDGVFCYNDRIAMRAHSYGPRCGTMVSDDIAIIAAQCANVQLEDVTQERVSARKSLPVV